MLEYALIESSALFENGIATMARRITQNRPTHMRYAVARSAAAPAMRLSVQTSPEPTLELDANAPQRVRKQTLTALVNRLDRFAGQRRLLLQLDDLYTRLYAYVRALVPDPLYTYVAGGNISVQQAEADLDSYFSVAQKSVHPIAQDTLQYLRALVRSRHLDEAEELVSRGSDRLVELIRKLA